MILIACNDPKLVGRWSRALREKYSLYLVSQKTSLLGAMSSLQPRILILDVRLPRLRAVRELPAIQGLSPLTKIVVISDRLTTSEGIAVLKAGVKGYSDRKITAALMHKLVKGVLGNELWVGR